MVILPSQLPKDLSLMILTNSFILWNKTALPPTPVPDCENYYFSVLNIVISYGKSSFFRPYFRFRPHLGSMPKERKEFVLLPKGWVVERTLGWLTWCRRLNKDYELLPETAKTFVYIAMIRIMVRRLA